MEQSLVFCGREDSKLVALRQMVREGLRPPLLIFVQSVERAMQLFHALVYDGSASAERRVVCVLPKTRCRSSGGLAAPAGPVRSFPSSLSSSSKACTLQLDWPTAVRT